MTNYRKGISWGRCVWLTINKKSNVNRRPVAEDEK